MVFIAAAATCARDVVGNQETAQDLKLAKQRGYELWEPSRKEVCVAWYSVVLPANLPFTLGGVIMMMDLSAEASLTFDLCHCRYRIMLQ